MIPANSKPSTQPERIPLLDYPTNKADAQRRATGRASRRAPPRRAAAPGRQQALVNLLPFTSVYFSELGLFNGLRPI